MGSGPDPSVHVEKFHLIQLGANSSNILYWREARNCVSKPCSPGHQNRNFQSPPVPDPVIQTQLRPWSRTKSKVSSLASCRNSSSPTIKQMALTMQRPCRLPRPVAQISMGVVGYHVKYVSLTVWNFLQYEVWTKACVHMFTKSALFHTQNTVEIWVQQKLFSIHSLLQPPKNWNLICKMNF